VAHLHEVAPGVLVGTSRFMVTNTVVVTSGGRALVVDPGVHDDELEAIGIDLLHRRRRPEAGFATHAHWDHVLWHEALGDVPRYATRQTVVDAASHRVELVEEAEAVAEVDLRRFAVLQGVDGTVVPWSGPEAHVIEHDAHAAGQAALHLPELGLLVAGDMGSDVEVPLLTHGIPGPEALLAHHEALDRLAALTSVDVVVPGHGHPCDGAAWRRRLDADRRYLDDLAAGHDTDARLVEPWLVDADQAMRATLTKAAWRRWVRELPPPAETDAVRAGLRSFLGARPGAVAAYEALPGEVDLTALLRGLDATVALPRIDGTAVTWHLDDGRGEPHPFGMRQPAADAPAVDPDDLDVVLVPGRLFDRHGTRLGRGGGHYDRLLPGLRPGVPAVGVTVEARVVPRLPTEAHDAPMTHLATELGVRATG
jgi:hydroxyacylglutathione hydrolase